MDDAVRLRFKLTRAWERERRVRSKLAEVSGERQALRRRVAGLEEDKAQMAVLIARLEQRIEDLEMRVRQDGTTSHQPPSKDPRWKQRYPSKPAGKGARQRGGQKRSLRRPPHDAASRARNAD